MIWVGETADCRGLPIILVLALCMIGCADERGSRQGSSPQDDFYEFTNGDWLRRTEIPPELPWISPFVTATLDVQGEIEKVIVKAAEGRAGQGPVAAKIGALYESLLPGLPGADERRTAERAARLLASIDAVQDPEALTAAFADFLLLHTHPNVEAFLPDVVPLRLSVWPDQKRKGEVALVIGPAGLSLPGPSYYLGRDEKTETLRRDFISTVRDMLALSGIDESDKAARAVWDVEAALAAAHAGPRSLHDAQAVWNPVAVTALDQLYPGLPWDILFEGAGVPPLGEVVVTQPDYLRALAAAVRDRPAAEWRAYLSWQFVRRYGPLLSEAHDARHFEFYGATLLGNEVRRPVQQRTALMVQEHLPDAVAQLWLAQFYSEETTRAVTELASSVRAAFIDVLEASDKFSSSTKAEALDKAQALRITVGHPQKWPEMSGLALREDTPLDNLMAISAWSFERQMDRLTRPVDPDRWFDAAFSTNAYYSRSRNELVLPAGYLRPPFFDPDAERAHNLGGLGTVIAHEMGHAFDDQGSRFDAEGRLRSWWTKEDDAAFERELGKLTRQYTRYEALPGLYLDGDRTVSENLADLTGVSVAFAALNPARGKGADEAEQRAFFTAYCARLAARYREPLLRRIIASDGHPPQKYRCNGPLSNFEPFYALYDVGPGDGMYREREERVSLWRR